MKSSTENHINVIVHRFEELDPTLLGIVFTLSLVLKAGQIHVHITSIFAMKTLRKCTYFVLNEELRLTLMSIQEN